jgi:hypothetical protein
MLDRVRAALVTHAVGPFKSVQPRPLLPHEDAPLFCPNTASCAQNCAPCSSSVAP